MNPRNCNIKIPLLSIGLFGFLIAGCIDVETDRLSRNEESAKSRIKELENEIAKLQKDIDGLEPDASNAEAAEKGINDAIEAKRMAQEETETLEPRVAEAIALLEAYRKEFRDVNTKSEIRATEGQKLGTFKLKTGKEIIDGVVSKIGDGQIGVKHRSGVAYIPLADLPESIFSAVVWETEAAKGIKVPEVNPRPIEDLRAVLARKPDALKTQQQQFEDRKLAAETKERQRQAELEAKRAAEQLADQRERAAAKARLDAMAARQRELDAKRAEIDARILKLRATLQSQQTAKSNQQIAWSRSNISVSAADQARVLGQYDAKINQLEAEIRDLESQRLQIR